MVEFSGASQKIKDRYLKDFSISLFWGFTISALPFSGIIIAVAAVAKVWAVLAFLAVIILICVGTLLLPKTKILSSKIADTVFPQCVKIDKEGVNARFKGFSLNCSLQDVKCAEDCGEYYRLIVCEKNRRDLLCVKQNLTGGSLVELEELLLGKITKKQQV